MSRVDVDEEILKPMQATFLPPRDLATEEQRLTLNGYATVLAGFDRTTLRAAWADVLAGHRTRAWPVPGVIVAAAHRVIRERPKVVSEISDAPINTQSERETHWRLVLGKPIAQRAAMLGVAWRLKCAVLNDGARMYQIDLDKFARDKAAAEITAQRIHARQPLTFHGHNIGVMDASLALRSLNMFNQLAVLEAQTSEEIAQQAMETEHAA